MIIARWKIDARFGHKTEVIEALEWWKNEIAPQIGWEDDNLQMMTGSVGANESTLVTQVKLKDMSELDDSWKKLSKIDRHRQWGKDLEPNVVSGSHRWEIYRVI